jgi:positive regulator of sigma E activity
MPAPPAWLVMLLYLVALVCFAVATWVAPKLAKLVPAGLTAWMLTLFWLALSRL